MTGRRALVLRARVLVTVQRPPLDDGAVVIRNGRVAAVGRWRGLRSQWGGETVVDLGERVLLPGLVNSHCHCDYTDMAGEIAPTRDFADWIKCITALKAAWSYSEFAQSWLNGARMLARTGTTTVADIEAVPELLPEVWAATPLRVFSFLEMTGIRSRRPPEDILAEAQARLAELPTGRGGCGFSPHAPYSTTPELLRLTAAAARRQKRRVVIHVAESRLEAEMFLLRRGHLFDFMERNQRDMRDCGGVSPVQHLERNRLLASNTLAIHANYLEPGDAATLARRRAHVVHCPRSHAYFSHHPFPLPELAAAGVNLCLGTDSLATTKTPWRGRVVLSMFDELRAFVSAFPDVPPTTVLEMATRNGARALGLSGKAGEIKPRAWADMIALPFKGRTAAVLEAIVQHSGEVDASLIDGQWVVSPPGLDETAPTL
jgi:cytosine/adenosine deaminase-related metal-dependent hydrolase